MIRISNMVNVLTCYSHLNISFWYLRSNLTLEVKVHILKKTPGWRRNSINYNSNEKGLYKYLNWFLSYWISKCSFWPQRFLSYWILKFCFSLRGRIWPRRSRLKNLGFKIRHLMVSVVIWSFAPMADSFALFHSDLSK